MRIPVVPVKDGAADECGWGDEALDKCKHWIVLEPLVYIMPKADPKQTVKDKLGQLGQGQIVEGDGVRIDGWEAKMKSMSGIRSLFFFLKCNFDMLEVASAT
ncbi:unnamed protein product [Durusdinium trenchii]|uniref:Uncharacterized protein n=1 Tax=Durusdinium trenchii TaxID=1381693 RepID=A0ABP0MJE9_9DINO